MVVRTKSAGVHESWIQPRFIAILIYIYIYNIYIILITILWAGTVTVGFLYDQLCEWHLPSKKMPFPHLSQVCQRAGVLRPVPQHLWLWDEHLSDPVYLRPGGDACTHHHPVHPQPLPQDLPASFPSCGRHSLPADHLHPQWYRRTRHYSGNDHILVRAKFSKVLQSVEIFSILKWLVG